MSALSLGYALTWLQANTTAQGWAVVAAAFSPLSSFLIWRVQHNNFMESIRPELEMLEWARASQGEGTAGERAILTFRAIANVGRGTAFDTWLRVDHDPANRYHMASAHRLPMIAPVTGQLPLPGRIIVWFQNASWDALVVFVPLRLTFRDSRGNVYETLFSLDVLRAGGTYAGYTIAPNVTMTRHTTMTTARRMRFRARRNRFLLRLGRIPVLGRLLFRKP